jgi:predicted DNA-binding protein (MmcQ/YjbR family)
MELAEVVEHCMGKPGAQESYPWGDGELVCKVGGKAFAFIGLESKTVGLKCGANADEADEWRQRHPEAIVASAYIGRYGWNRVQLGAGVPADEVRELLDSSYDEVVSRLPKSKRPKG